jgi:hypothetical protein
MLRAGAFLDRFRYEILADRFPPVPGLMILSGVRNE